MGFICDKCGACCRNLHRSPLYAELDSGNGTCKYLKGNLCSIYASRPEICRIDRGYDLFFADKMSREEYYQRTYEVCRSLKRPHNERDERN